MVGRHRLSQVPLMGPVVRSSRGAAFLEGAVTPASSARHPGSGRGGIDPPGKGQEACRGPWGRPVSTAPLSLSIRSVMQKYLEDRGEVTFEKIFSQKLGE